MSRVSEDLVGQDNDPAETRERDQDVSHNAHYLVLGVILCACGVAIALTGISEGVWLRAAIGGAGAAAAGAVAFAELGVHAHSRRFRLTD